MDYTELTAKELQALCRSRNLPTARAKADMIETLTEADARTETPTLSDGEYVLSKKALETVSTPSEPEPVPAEPEPTPEPPQADPAPPATDFWVEDGGFTIRVTRHGKLDDREHRHNLNEVVTTALEYGFTPYGPAFRVTDPDSQTWVYRVWVR